MSAVPPVSTCLNAFGDRGWSHEPCKSQAAEKYANAARIRPGGADTRNGSTVCG